jgi:hypothetical protein
MRLDIELISIEIEKNTICWVSLLEINHNSLFYIEWGRGWLQINLFFDLIKYRKL